MAYPNSHDNLATNKTDATTASTDHPGHHNSLASAINAIETELGLTPKGSEASVAARLAAHGGSLQRKVITLTDPTYQNSADAHRPVVTGTFVAQRSEVELEANLSGTIAGAYGSGAGCYVLLGTPNAGGELVEDIVYHASHGTFGYIAKPGATLVGRWNLGGTHGENVRLELNRRIVATGLTPGTTYQVGIWTTKQSGFDQIEMPAAQGLGACAVNPVSMEAGDVVDREFWVVAQTPGVIYRVSIGRRKASSYRGVQPRLMVLSQLAVGTTPLGIAINGNGLGAVANWGSNNVTIFDTTANNRSGAVVATSATFAARQLRVVAAPDNSGFWVTDAGGNVRKFDNTGAVVATYSYGASDGTALIDISPDGNTIYVFRGSADTITPIATADGTAGTVISGLSDARAMAISPDGAYLLLAPAIGGSVQRVATANGAVTLGHRVGVTETMAETQNGIVVGRDGYHWFSFGNEGTWCYGKVSDMTVYDRQRTADATKPNYAGACAADQDAIYWSANMPSGGDASIRGWPGSSFDIVNEPGAGHPMAWGQAQIVVLGGS